MSISEFEIINQYFSRQARHGSVTKSIGDDCALLSVPNGYQLALSMDTLVCGRHFPDNALPEQIAQRAFCTCLSDLAAMGAEPRWFTLGLTLPSADIVWLEAFSRGLFELADEYQCDLIGGDTTQGPLTITLQVHGFVKSDLALQRDGAKEGDKLFVTQSLGDGAAALRLLLNNMTIAEEHRRYLQQRFYRPEPQIAVGRLIAPYATAAIDVSDGLLADLQHIADASKVDLRLHLDAIPISSACRAVANDDALTFALTGGDDYQLAFTVPIQHCGKIQALIDDKQRVLTEIGEVVAMSNINPKVHCLHKDKMIDPAVAFHHKKGYQHFAS